MQSTGAISIPGLGDPLEEEMMTHCSICAWKVFMDRGGYCGPGVSQSETVSKLAKKLLRTFRKLSVGSCT